MHPLLCDPATGERSGPGAEGSTLVQEYPLLFEAEQRSLTVLVVAAPEDQNRHLGRWPEAFEAEFGPRTGQAPRGLGWATWVIWNEADLETLPGPGWRPGSRRP